MRKVGIGIIGAGTIGSEVARQLREQRKQFGDRKRTELNLEMVCDKEEKRNPHYRGVEFTTNSNDLLGNEDIDIIVETVGGIEFPYDFMNKSLKKGRHVVTANKAAVDKHGRELQETAIKQRRYLKISAAVGGGMRIIPYIMGHKGNNTTSFFGILNGTTNYVLTRMSEGLEYKQALREAQEKGFAEANPEFDVSGKDAGQKLAILLSVLFDTRIYSRDIVCRGIENVSRKNISNARKEKSVLKLLAIGQLNKRKLEAIVCPALVLKNHPLASVNYEENAIQFDGNGPITIRGKGAGAKPTAGTVVSDIIEIARMIQYGCYHPDRYFGNMKYKLNVPLELPDGISLFPLD